MRARRRRPAAAGDPRGLNSRVQCEGLTQERWDATQRMLQQRKAAERQQAQVAAAEQQAQAAAAEAQAPLTLAEWEQLLSRPAPYPMSSRVYTPLPARGTVNVDAYLREVPPETSTPTAHAATAGV